MVKNPKSLVSAWCALLILYKGKWSARIPSFYWVFDTLDLQDPLFSTRIPSGSPSDPPSDPLNSSPRYTPESPRFWRFANTAHVHMHLSSSPSASRRFGAPVQRAEPLRRRHAQAARGVVDQRPARLFTQVISAMVFDDIVLLLKLCVYGSMERFSRYTVRLAPRAPTYARTTRPIHRRTASRATVTARSFINHARSWVASPPRPPLQRRLRPPLAASSTKQPLLLPTRRSARRHPHHSERQRQQLRQQQQQHCRQRRTSSHASPYARWPCARSVRGCG